MGWGVIRKEGSRLRYVQHGAITTPSGWDMPRRLGRLLDGVTGSVEGYRPDAVAVEDVFFNTNVTTAITVGQACGVTLLAPYLAGITVSGYTPLQVKQAVTSYGRADKRQVQEMVRTLLNLREIPRPDDAAHTASPLPTPSPPGIAHGKDTRRAASNPLGQSPTPAALARYGRPNAPSPRPSTPSPEARESITPLAGS